MTDPTRADAVREVECENCYGHGHLDHMRKDAFGHYQVAARKPCADCAGKGYLTTLEAPDE